MHKTEDVRFMQMKESSCEEPSIENQMEVSLQIKTFLENISRFAQKKSIGKVIFPLSALSVNGHAEKATGSSSDVCRIIFLHLYEIAQTYAVLWHITPLSLHQPIKRIEL